MADIEQPQIYLITPPELDLDVFPDLLAKTLEARDIACLRLSLSTQDEDQIARAADALRDVAHARDVALVIDTHLVLAERLGLDGVHVNDGARGVSAARKALGEEAIVGAFCGQSRHDGMSAGEAGADYISFGPIGTSALGDGAVAEREIFEWWSQMIEIPVVAEGALTAELVREFSPVTDFFGIGAEIWNQEDPAAALGAFYDAMTG